MSTVDSTYVPSGIEKAKKHTKPGERDSWRTPDKLYQKLHSEFFFFIDLAADVTNTKCPNYFTREQNALGRPWPALSQGWCWLNPPFSMLTEFLAKVWEECCAGSGIVMMAPGHRHEQGWFHDHVIGKAAEIRIPRGHVNYATPTGAKTAGATFPSMVLVYDPRKVQTLPVPTLLRGL